LYNEVQQARQRGASDGSGGGGTYSNSDNVRNALTSANQYVHSHGFPNVFITGTGSKGELLGQDDHGNKVHLRDGAKGSINAKDESGHEVKGDSSSGEGKGTKVKMPNDEGGNKINSDGSGTYNVNGGKQGAWGATRQVLEDQAHQRGQNDWHASNTDIANAQRKMAAEAGFHGKHAVDDWAKHLKPGDIKAPAADLRGSGAADVAKKSAGENPQVDSTHAEQMKNGGNRLVIEGKLNSDAIDNVQRKAAGLVGSSYDPRASFKGSVETEKGTGAVKEFTTAYTKPQTMGHLYNPDGTAHASVSGVEAEEVKTGKNGSREFTFYGKPGHHTYGHFDKEGRMVVDKQD
jgi:hypothetical protein